MNPSVDAKNPTGAVRSADADLYDFTSIPLIGLLAVARTAKEGATKYGRLNYMLGMPLHQYLNHANVHLTMYMLGDRSEPHLAHAAWNIMASIQTETLDPEASAPHMLGPGATLTEANRKYLDDNREDLSARREAGEFADVGKWSVSELPEVVRLLNQRKAVSDVALDVERLISDAFGDIHQEDGSTMGEREFESRLRRLLLYRTGREEFNTQYDPKADGPPNIAGRDQAYDLDSGGIVDLKPGEFVSENKPTVRPTVRLYDEEDAIEELPTLTPEEAEEDEALIHEMTELLRNGADEAQAFEDNRRAEVRSAIKDSRDVPYPIYQDFLSDPL